MKTTINEKEVRLYGRKELSKEFTRIASGYISEGYLINYSAASSGSQGEEMKIDLSNDGGKTVLRVWMDKGSEKVGSEWYQKADVIKITVEKFEDAENKTTLWYGRGEKVLEKTYYHIARRDRDEIYCEEKSEYLQIAEKQEARWRASRIEREYVEVSESYKKIALKSVKKIKGYKSTLLVDIEKIFRQKNKYSNGFSVKLKNGKSCYLSLKK